MIGVGLTVGRDVPRSQARAAGERLAALDDYIDGPLSDARLTLRHKSAPPTPYVADASVILDGRLIAAHATGPSALAATDAVIDRLRRQLRRSVDADVARRNEPAIIRKALAALDTDRGHRPWASAKPPEERAIVHRRPYSEIPIATLEAVADLLDLDAHFNLFRHVRSNEDAVAYRRDDGRVGLIHPRGSVLADENDVVTPQPSRYSEPLTLDTARTEMDELNHRFLYFVDAMDHRGRVIYLRHDGDYGLVEPA